MITATASYDKKAVPGGSRGDAQQELVERLDRTESSVLRIEQMLGRLAREYSGAASFHGLGDVDEEEGEADSGEAEAEAEADDGAGCSRDSSCSVPPPSKRESVETIECEDEPQAQTGQAVVEAAARSLRAAEDKAPTPSSPTPLGLVGGALGGCSPSCRASDTRASDQSQASDAPAADRSSRAKRVMSLTQQRRISMPAPYDPSDDSSSSPTSARLAAARAGRRGSAYGRRRRGSSAEFSASMSFGRRSSMTSGGLNRLIQMRSSESPLGSDMGSRHTLEELRHMSNDGNAATVLDASQIAELVRWDVSVRGVLKELKRGQEVMMQQEHTNSQPQAKGAKPRSGSYKPATIVPQLRTSASTIRVAGQGSGFGSEFGGDTSLSRPRRWIVQPDGKARTWFDLLIAVLIVYTLISTPLLAFFIKNQTRIWWILNGICDFFFVLDILVTFRTAVPDRLLGVVITSPSVIAKRYLRGWFLTDLVATFPFDYIFLIVQSANSVDVATANEGSIVGRLLRLSRVLKALRLLRMVVAARKFAWSESESYINPSVKTLIKLLLSLCIYWHWCACIYYYLSLDGREHYPQSEWLFGLTHGDSDWAPPPKLLSEDTNAFVRYSYALYWAVGLSSQINLPTPDTVPQQVFSLIVSMSGVLTLSMIIGSATTVVADISAQTSEVSKRLQRISRYMTYKQLPKALRTRVLSYYTFQFESSHQLDEATMLVDLPRSLKLQMDVVVHQAVFLRLPLFRLCKEEEILMIVQCLKPALALPGEALVRQGEKGVGLFFLMKGVVEILSGDVMICLVSAVAAFGESALLPDATPTATVRAERFCEVTVLIRSDFESIVNINPHILKYLQLYTSQRDAQMRSNTEAACRLSQGSSPQERRREGFNELQGGGNGRSRHSSWEDKSKGGYVVPEISRQNTGPNSRPNSARAQAAPPPPPPSSLGGSILRSLGFGKKAPQSSREARAAAWAAGRPGGAAYRTDLVTGFDDDDDCRTSGGSPGGGSKMAEGRHFAANSRAKPTAPKKRVNFRQASLTLRASARLSHVSERLSNVRASLQGQRSSVVG